MNSKAPDRVFHIAIAAPIDAVWDALTETETRQSFYFDSRLHSDLKPGSEMAYRSDNGKHTFILGEVLEVSPPNRLVHTFSFAGSEEPWTKVTITLAENAGKTEVTIRHEGLDKAPKTTKRVARGWPHILGNLKRILEKGSLSVGVRTAYGLMKGLSVFMPRR